MLSALMSAQTADFPRLGAGGGEGRWRDHVRRRGICGPAAPEGGVSLTVECLVSAGPVCRACCSEVCHVGAHEG